MNRERLLSKKSAVIAALFAVGFATLSMRAMAEERSFSVHGGQASVPIGLVVQVKKIAISDDATKVHLLASFDSHETNSINMNDNENAYLAWGEGADQRLHMRQIADNKWMRIGNGKTMEGELIFPGVLPADVRKVTLVFNPGRGGDDITAPGVILPLELGQ